MLNIAFSLLGAWILNWFGFANLVNDGMTQLFGIHISISSYYFIFACIGEIKSIINTFHYPNIKISDKNKNNS